jgi:predicted sulfurtransferase
MDSVSKKLTNKNSKIVVYCSLGIRSEDIGEKLKKAGYKNVYNLYGGIFEFKNQNLSIYNSKGNTTDSIHAYSKTWGKWLKNGIKIYD